MNREKRLYLLIKLNFLYWLIENIYGFSTGMVKLITNLIRCRPAGKYAKFACMLN